MPGRSQASDRFARMLALVAFAGLAGRLLFLYLSRDWELLGDGFAYRIEAARLVSDHIVQGPLHPPAWTFVMAVPPALGLDALGYQQVLAALIGTATIVVTGLAGRKAFGPRTGLVAAGLVAVYPNMWLYEREVLSEPLAMLSVATCILALYWFRERPSSGRAAVLGVQIGLMALIRSELILVSVLAFLPLALAASDVTWRTRTTWLVVAGAVSALLIAPWTIYNSTRFERPVALSSGLGPAMQAGNCSPVYEGDIVGYYEFACIYLLQGVSRDPTLADGELRQRALDFMGEDIGRSAQVAVIRVGRAFNVYRPFQQVHLETERGSEPWVIRAGLLFYWALLPLAVAGAVLARRRHIPVYPILVFPAIVVLSVLPTIGSVRYRAPAEVPLVLLAAVTLAHLHRSWAARPGGAT